MKTIGVLAHPELARATEAAAQVKVIAKALGINTIPACEEHPVDVVLALGGDGTILRAALIARYHNVALLGVNLGKLGFLSTIDAGRLEVVVAQLAEGRYIVEERMMLDARAIRPSGEVEIVTALNEVVLERGTLSRVVSIKVSVGAQVVATYVADGFIVSTPTGSTAYSLSAGGPVLEPQLQAMVLTSVSAHSPLWRSIVVGPQRTVSLETPTDTVALSADGQAVGILPPGSRVVVAPNPRPLKLVTFEGVRFYDKLRARFHVEPTNPAGPS